MTNPSSSLSTGQWLASDVYKADVYDPSEHKVGKVTDLMIDSNGAVTGVIISAKEPADAVAVHGYSGEPEIRQGSEG